MHRLRLKWDSYYESWLDNDVQNFKLLFQDSILETKKKTSDIFQYIAFSGQDLNPLLPITNLGMPPATLRH